MLGLMPLQPGNMQTHAAPQGPGRRCRLRHHHDRPDRASAVMMARFWSAILLVSTALSAQPARRAVIIDVDGIRRDTFEQVYRDGRLPNFQRIFARALWFDNASTVLPSVTMAAQASIFTGTQPARHGIPGNQWFDRSAGPPHRLYDPGRPHLRLRPHRAGRRRMFRRARQRPPAGAHHLRSRRPSRFDQRGLLQPVLERRCAGGAARHGRNGGFSGGQPGRLARFRQRDGGASHHRSEVARPAVAASRSILREPMASRTTRESRARWRIFPAPSTRCSATFWMPSNRSTRRGARIRCSFWFQTMAAQTWWPIPKTPPSRPTCRPRFRPARPSRKTAAWRTSTSTSPVWWTFRSWRRRWCRMPSCRPRWPPCGCAARRIRRATAT